jgi:hypothetical protein
MEAYQWRCNPQVTKRNVFTARKPKGRQADNQMIQAIMAVAAECWECIALRKK